MNRGGGFFILRCSMQGGIPAGCDLELTGIVVLGSVWCERVTFDY